MKKLALVLLVFITTGLFADGDPQAFSSLINLRLSITSFAAVVVEDFSSQLSLADARQQDENNDGYIFVSYNLSATTDQLGIVNVNTRKVVALYLSNDPNFPQFVRNNGWTDYGDISVYSNLKAQLINDYAAACQGIGLQTRSTSTTINISVPASQSGTQPQQQSGTQPAQVTIVNNTGYTIWYVYISPSTDSNWGPDRLGSTQTIRSGQSVTLNIPDPTVTQYDIKVIDSDGDSYTKMNVRISANSRIVFTIDDFDN